LLWFDKPKSKQSEQTGPVDMEVAGLKTRVLLNTYYVGRYIGSLALLQTDRRTWKQIYLAADLLVIDADVLGI
jgi:hypothetical protein